MKKFVRTFTILASLICGRGHSSQTIQAMDLRDLEGRYTDELPKPSESGRFTQPLAGNPSTAFEYRELGAQEYVLLLSRHTSGRWKIVDALKIPEHSKEEFISFACSKADGPPPDAGSGFVGLVKAGNSKHIVPALKAWKVDLENKRLKPVQDIKTVCNLHGAD